MNKKGNLLKGTFEIRKRLPDLLGDEWKEVDRDLGHLQARHLAGEDVAKAIIDLLHQHKPTKELADRVFSVDLPGRYESFGGNQTHAPGGIEMYECPEQGCHYAWISHKPGQQVPHCPKHDCELRKV